MVGAGAKLVVLAAVVIGTGLTVRHVFGQEGVRSDRQITQKITPIKLSSPNAWDFNIELTNNTDQELRAVAIMAARDCNGAQISLLETPIVLPPNGNDMISFQFIFDPDVFDCSSVGVDFFIWNSLTGQVALAARKTVGITF